jgi:hypothetical protein
VLLSRLRFAMTRMNDYRVNYEISRKHIELGRTKIKKWLENVCVLESRRAAVVQQRVKPQVKNLGHVGEKITSSRERRWSFFFSNLIMYIPTSSLHHY